MVPQRGTRVLSPSQGSMPYILILSGCLPGAVSSGVVIRLAPGRFLLLHTSPTHSPRRAQRGPILSRVAYDQLNFVENTRSMLGTPPPRALQSFLTSSAAPVGKIWVQSSQFGPDDWC
ncbi:hypothetical protein BDW62DRAFT_193652 [Aspergillus aurantiobrunneus]